jgi:hypothetical protein
VKQCNHARKGIVTNQPDGYDRNRAHAARNCCDRPACIEAAKSWAAGITNETAYYVPDSDRTARL